MDVKGEMINQGKTKTIYHHTKNENHVVVVGKDRITAFNNEKRAHDMEGKAELSNSLNAKIFNLLNSVGIKTSFVKTVESKIYIAKKCQMIPIEWVARRVATGSFLKRNPGVEEGYTFKTLKIETFLKDDANDDPQISMEQIIAKTFQGGAKQLHRFQYDLMEKQTRLVFEVLEKAWSTLGCALIDMKIEFGFDSQSGEIILSDVIDNESWRLWPAGDKRLMMDKQVYRNLENVTEEALQGVKRNFEWVDNEFAKLNLKQKGKVVIVMGSPSDVQYGKKIVDECTKRGVNSVMRICSAHKSTDWTFDLIAEYESLDVPVVFVAVAGRSNGLGPVLSGNTTFPVINCPPLGDCSLQSDIWSSLNTPSGLGCATVIYPGAAAQCSASILAQVDFVTWAHMKVGQFNMWRNLRQEDFLLTSRA